LQNSASLARSLAGIGRSERQTRMSGAIPIERSSLTECWVGLVFSSPAAAMIGQQREMHEDALAARLVLRELADRLEEGQPLDVADGAADLAEHEIDLVLADGDEVLDLVGDVRDHLDGLAQVVAAPLLLEHGLE
jgi:hypothetical protein